MCISNPVQSIPAVKYLNYLPYLKGCLRKFGLGPQCLSHDRKRLSHGPCTLRNMSLQRNFAARLGHFRSNKLTSEEHSDVIFSYAGRFQAVNVNSCVFVYTFTSLNDDPNEPELSTTFTHHRSDFSPAAALFLIDWAAAAHLCSYEGCRGAGRTYVGRLRTPSTGQPSRGRRQLLALYSTRVRRIRDRWMVWCRQQIAHSLLNRDILVHVCKYLNNAWCSQRSSR